MELLTDYQLPPDLLRQILSALRRCLWFQKKLKLSKKCTEWRVHAVESQVFSANNLLNLSKRLLIGGRLPDSFSSSGCCFTIISPYVHLAYNVFNSWVCGQNMWDSFYHVIDPILVLDGPVVCFLSSLSLAVWGWEFIQFIWQRSRVLKQWHKSVLKL